MIQLKQKIYRHYLDKLQNRIRELQARQEDLQESLKQETKSTAGDKYETARAMVHIEQENTGRQLATLLQEQAELESIDITTQREQVGPGSLVQTDNGYLFVSTGQGKAEVEGHTVFALSPRSPLGQQLMGCRTGASVERNGLRYLVKKIY